MKTVIEARRFNFHLQLGELFRYRELLWMLAYRDYRIRYAQTLLGFLWAFIQPLLTLLIFVLVFNKAAKIDSAPIPYSVFAMTGMWAWSYFAYVMSQAGQSIISSQALVTKVYFPRLVIPVSKSVVGFIDFSIAFLMLVGLMLYYHIMPSINIVALPLFIIEVILLSLATGIWLSALTIRFRDFTYVIPFMVQIGLYVSPIAYPSALVPDEYKLYYYLNPIAGIVEGFRWAMLGTPLPELKFLIIEAVIIFLLLLSGLFYFKRVERLIADII